MGEQNPRLLVTIALEETWGSKELFVYLGGWYRIYDCRDVWSKRKYILVHNQLGRPSKLKRDYGYLGVCTNRS